MENLPQSVSILFIATVFLTIFLFSKATPSRFITVAFLLAWAVLFVVLGKMNVFYDTTAMPPRFIFMTGPAALIMILFFITKKGRAFIDRMDLRALTRVHVVRLPVEIVLFLLALHKTIPELLTFEGRNFDIVMGITAYPVMWWIFTRNGTWKLLLAWNFLGLVLLFNVVIHGVLSLPFPFQQFAHEQPNAAMLYSPYLLLPGLIVPVVMFSHFAAIRRLVNSKRITD